MATEAEARRVLRDLLQAQGLGVLATYGGATPYCSLVAFAPTADGRELLFATTRRTRKYANLTADPHAAMLIDSRANMPADFQRAVAATAIGETAEVNPEARENCLRAYLGKHPHLADFVKAPTCALLRLRVKTYVVVQRFQEVTELHP